MIQVVGQATQKNGSNPTWVLSGLCKAASRTGTGTYTVTMNFANNFGITNKNQLVILVSAERSGTGTERYVIDWISDDTFRIRNYTKYNSTTLGDCMLTITILANLQ